MKSNGVVAGIDIGAGSGAKIGIFDTGMNVLSRTLLSAKDYGAAPATLVAGLVAKTRGALRDQAVPRCAGLKAAGIACPGFAGSDGTVRGVANIPMLNNANLADLLGMELEIPVTVANDADCGGLAEWDHARSELLYWALGGGWGGAWIGKEGSVRFPSSDWDGTDAHLHYTNEPGYAIPLDRSLMTRVFAEEDVEFQAFEELAAREGLPLSGPSGRSDCVRAELIVSGGGRRRIFEALLARRAESDLDPASRLRLADPHFAGAVLDELSRDGYEPAVRTDRLFGRVLGESACILFDRAAVDGCPKSIPIFFAGQPSKALPYFGPSAERVMTARGITGRMGLSYWMRTGGNANMHGAALRAARKLL